MEISDEAWEIVGKTRVNVGILFRQKMEIINLGIDNINKFVQESVEEKLRDIDKSRGSSE